MKTATIVPKPTEASKPGAATPPPGETLNLSPERIEDGASAKTEVIEEILAQTEETTGLRHWGINE
jgi:hypothetical protein